MKDVRTSVVIPKAVQLVSPNLLPHTKICVEFFVEEVPNTVKIPHKYLLNEVPFIHFLNA